MTEILLEEIKLKQQKVKELLWHIIHYINQANSKVRVLSVFKY